MAAPIPAARPDRARRRSRRRPVVARVHVDSWRGAYVDLLPRAVLDGLSVDRRTAAWTRVLAPSMPGCVVVAEVAGLVVGFAHVGPAHDPDLGPETGQLATIYVDPGHWGSGVGRVLHDTGLERLAAAGCTGAVLWMLSTNARAAAFYRRRGWGRGRAPAPPAVRWRGGPRPTAGPAADTGVTSARRRAEPGAGRRTRSGQIFSRPSQYGSRSLRL